MMHLSELLIVIIISQLLVFSVFLLLRRKNINTHNRILALFFLSLAINLFNHLTFRLFNFFYINYPFLFFIGSPFAYLYAPLFYIYAESLTFKSNHLKAKKLVHFIPFILFQFYLIVAFHFHTIDQKRQLLMDHSVFPGSLWQILIILLQVQVFVYIIFVIRVIKKHGKEIKNHYSVIEHINFNWFQFIFYGMLALWFVDILRSVSFLYAFQSVKNIETFLFGSFLILCYMTLYKALTQPQVFSGLNDIIEKRKTSLSLSLQSQYLNEILSYMDNYKPYLDPELTLFELSEKVSIPPRSLSDVLNNKLCQNFYDFINGYRIKESEKLLSSCIYKNKTILEILYEVGFNSKSSFNNAFKKHTGMTPSEYKQSFYFINESEKRVAQTA